MRRMSCRFGAYRARVTAAHANVKVGRICGLTFVEKTECTMSRFGKRSINKASSHENYIVSIDDVVINQRFIYIIIIIKSGAQSRTRIYHLLSFVAFLRKAPINILRHCLFADGLRKFVFMNNERVYVLKDIKSWFLACISHRDCYFDVLIFRGGGIHFNINRSNPSAIASLQGDFDINQRPIADYHQYDGSERQNLMRVWPVLPQPAKRVTGYGIIAFAGMVMYLSMAFLALENFLLGLALAVAIWLGAGWIVYYAIPLTRAW
jgi:hypothetical protein